MSRPNIGKSRAPGTFSLIPLTLFAAVTLSSWWYATQWVARALAYQAGLGLPWFGIFGFRIYLPWKVFSWNYWYHVYAPRIFVHGMAIAYVGPALGVVLVIAYAVWVARRARVATTHGAAIWEEDEDTNPALLSGRGVVLGQTKDGRYLQHDGPEHVISIAPTRSGKGVGQIIPTLLTWPESVVVHDFKAENWKASAGARAQFSHCLYFNPIDRASCHYNPLAEIRPGDQTVADAQNVAQLLVDPDGKGFKQHWDRTSFSLLVASILHLLHAESDKTLSGLATFLADPRRDIDQTLKLMLTTEYPDPAVSRTIQSTAREMLQKDVRELSAVVSTALGFLSLYRDPLIAANTADSDFQILDLMQSERPVSLYIVVPPADKARLLPLIRMLWSQIGGRLTERLDLPDRRHRVLLMIDELPSLGRLEFVQSSLAFIAGYGIKAFLIVQSKKQLEEVYGRNNSILDNCQVRTFFTPNDIETANEISAMLGTKTEVHQQKMYTGHRLAPWLAHVMVADQETGRPLLTPGEVLTLGNDEAILFLSGRPPMRVWKIRYYADRNFKQRLRPVPKLSTKGPYPYRPKSRATPWAGKTIAVPASVPAPAAAPAAQAAPEVQERARQAPWIRPDDDGPPNDFLPEVILEEGSGHDLHEDPKRLGQRAALDRESGTDHLHHHGQLGLGL